MRNLVVDKKYDNKKLSKLLLDTFPALKYGIFVKALKKKDILINEKRVSRIALYMKMIESKYILSMICFIKNMIFQ